MSNLETQLVVASDSDFDLAQHIETVDGLQLRVNSPAYLHYRHQHAAQLKTLKAFDQGIARMSNSIYPAPKDERTSGLFESAVINDDTVFGVLAAARMAVSLCSNRPRTQGITRSMFMGMVKAAYIVGDLSLDAWTRFSEECKSWKIGDAAQAGIFLSDDDLAQLKSHVASLHSTESLASCRNMALISVLIHGLRASEVCDLRWSNVLREDRKVKLRFSGKTGERKVPLNAEARQNLKRLEAFPHEEDAYIFTKVFKGGKRSSQNRMYPENLTTMVKGWLKEIGLTGSAHDFRRSLISRLLQRGYDPMTIARVTGHKDVNMVKRYDRRPDEVAESMVEDL